MIYSDQRIATWNRLNSSEHQPRLCAQIYIMLDNKELHHIQIGFNQINLNQIQLRHQVACMISRDTWTAATRHILSSNNARRQFLPCYHSTMKQQTGSSGAILF